MEYMSLSSLLMDLEDNNVQLRAAGYFIKTRAHNMKESIREMEDCIQKLEASAKQMLDERELNRRDNDHLAA